MEVQGKSKDELIIMSREFIQKNKSLLALINKHEAEFILADRELLLQNREKEKRADELGIADKELVYQNEEKEKRAAELIIANIELARQNEQKEKRANELMIANKELIFQNREKEKRADELVLVNKELAYQNAEKEKRAAELNIANEELALQNELKEKRAAELVIANKELSFQNREREKRADELIIANKELAYQTDEKEKRAAELIIANFELVQQNELKEKRAAELIITNKELQQLIQLNEDKNKFFSIITHDLRNPFNSIIGFSNLLLEQIKKKDLEKIDKYANVILQSSNKAMDLLMSLMDWAQAQDGRMDFNPEYYEIRAVINEVVLLMNDIAEHKSIDISSEIPNEIKVYSDKAMVVTVLRNLISNAIKFTQIEGKIMVFAEIKQNELIVSISDNGVGISKARIDKLFKITEKHSTPGTQKEKGTGLGCILCKEFIEKNKGKIWIESQVGIGTTFYFTLPLNEESIID